MGKNSNATKKRFRLTKNWIVLIVVVACLGACIGSCFLVRSLKKDPAQKVFESYLSAAKKQNVEKMAETFYKKGSDAYNIFVQDYKDGKAEYEAFLFDNSQENVDVFLKIPEVVSDEGIIVDPRDRGLRLEWEQTLANNIDEINFSVLRQDKDQIVYKITVVTKRAYTSGQIPGKYGTYVGSSVTDTYTVKIAKNQGDGKWYFATDFRLIKGQGIEDTWTAEYNGGKELKRVNPDKTSGETLVISDIDEDIISIGAYALENCVKIKHIVIPDNLENISAYAFAGCTMLESVRYASGREVALDSDITLGDGVFFRCEKLESFVVPSVNKMIPNYLFAGCKALKTTAISDQTQVIGYYSFYNCAELLSITIPETVRNIGNAAFEGCAKLTTIATDNKLPQNLQNLGANAFKNCKVLASIILPESLTEISSGVFEGCKALTSIEFPQNLQEVGKLAFADTSLTEITLPHTVKNIGDKAFASTKITTDADYVESRLASITWQRDSKGKTSIRTIGEEAFYNCDKLTLLSLPETIQGIGKAAFIGCTKVRSVMLDFAGTAALGENIFAYSQGIPKIYVKKDVDTFKRAWNTLRLDIYPQSIIDESGELAILNQTRTIASGDTITEKILIQYLGTDTEPTLDTTITRLGDGAFAHFTNLVSIKNFKDMTNLTDIGADVFAGCTKLKYDRFGGNNQKGYLNYLGAWLIDGGEAGNTVLNLTTTYDFVSGSGNPRISNVNETVGIAASALTKADGITGVVLNSELQYISKNAFYQLAEMATLEFQQGSKLKRIGERAFSNCEILDHVNLPDSVVEIESGAFYNCGELRYVIVNSDKNVQLGENVFIVIQNVLKIYVNNFTGNNYYNSNANWTNDNLIIYDTDVLDAQRKYAYVGDTLIQLLADDAPFTVPDNLVIIGESAFARSAIETVVLHDKVQRIEQFAFYGCAVLKDVTFKANAGKDSLRYIGDNAFEDLEYMAQEANAKIVFEATEPNDDFEMSKIAFDTAIIRKVYVGIRENYIDNNEYWMASRDVINAADDPEIIVRLELINGDPTTHENKVNPAITVPGVVEHHNAPGIDTNLVAEVDKANGYVFDGWYDQNNQKVTPIDQEGFTIAVKYGEKNTDKTYTAKFKRENAWLTVTSNENTHAGTITATSGGNTKNVDLSKDDKFLVNTGSTTVLVATPTDEYDFEGWYIGGVKVTEGVSIDGNRVTFNLPMEYIDKTVEARFTKERAWVEIVYPKAEFGTVVVTNIPAGAKTEEEDITARPIKVLLAKNESITFTVTENTGFEFVEWRNVAAHLDTNTTFNLVMNAESPQEMRVIALFRTKIVVEIPASTEGSVAALGTPAAGIVDTTDPTKLQLTIIDGQTVSLLATAADGYKFVGWMRGGKIISTSVTLPFNIDSGIESGDVTAMFCQEDAIIVRLRLPVATEGTVEMLDASNQPIGISYEAGEEIIIVLNAGDSVTINATAAAGYQFTKWNKRIGQQQSDLATTATYEIRFADFEEDVLITATFTTVAP